MMKLIGWSGGEKSSRQEQQQQRNHQQGSAGSSNENAGSKKADASVYNSQVGKDCIAAGDMELAAGIKVMGTVLGSITVREGGPNNIIIVHADASITGDLKADMVLVAGKVEGVITGRSVKLYAGSVVNGGVEYGNISVQDGARLNGHTKHDDRMVSDEEFVVSATANEVDDGDGTQPVAEEPAVIAQ